MALVFECRADGTVASSSSTLEDLAARVATTVAATSSAVLTAWDCLAAVEGPETESGFTGDLRTITLTYTLFAIPAA
jgi:hypothetical protein